MVDAVDNGAVHVFRGCGDQDLFCPLAQVHVGLGAVVEFSGAFQHNVTAGPVKLFWIIGGHHINGPTTQIHGVPVNGDRAAEAPMDAVVFQKMRVCRDGARCVDPNHLNVVARTFGDVGQCAASDSAKAVDPDGDSHGVILVQVPWYFTRSIRKGAPVMKVKSSFAPIC